jgi:hypothetical protein
MGQIASQLGASEQQSQSAVAAAIPVLMGALARNSQKSDGASALSGALERDHDGSILDDLGSFIGGGGAAVNGAGILGHVLGGKRGQVESYVGKSSGLDAGSTAKLMEMLAPIVMGSLGAQKRSQGLDAGGIGDLLGNVMQQQTKQNQGSAGLLGKLLDADGDGDMTDDLLNMGGKLLGGLFKK